MFTKAMTTACKLNHRKIFNVFPVDGCNITVVFVVLMF